MSFIFVIKAEFSASLLQSSVSHDPSEIIHASVHISFLNAYMHTGFIFLWYVFFRLLWWIKKVQKNSIINVFVQHCNIINVFAVAFDQFNASLLNKKKNNYIYIYIYIYKKKTFVPLGEESSPYHTDPDQLLDQHSSSDLWQIKTK